MNIVNQRFSFLLWDIQIIVAHENCGVIKECFLSVKLSDQSTRKTFDSLLCIMIGQDSQKSTKYQFLFRRVFSVLSSKLYFCGLAFKKFFFNHESWILEYFSRSFNTFISAYFSCGRCIAISRICNIKIWSKESRLQIKMLNSRRPRIGPCLNKIFDEELRVSFSLVFCFLSLKQDFWRGVVSVI